MRRKDTQVTLIVRTVIQNLHLEKLSRKQNIPGTQERLQQQQPVTEKESRHIPVQDVTQQRQKKFHQQIISIRSYEM